MVGTEMLDTNVRSVKEARWHVAEAKSGPPFKVEEACRRTLQSYLFINHWYEACGALGKGISVSLRSEILIPMRFRMSNIEKLVHCLPRQISSATIG
jgi:hypothetical protein